MIYIDDSDVCPKCGAYWSTAKAFCCNGHSNPNWINMREHRGGEGV